MITKLDKMSWVGVSDVMNKNIWRALLAEFFGTLVLVYIGCASTMQWGLIPVPRVHIALCFGLVIATMVQIMGPVSGCHINPAISIGLIITGNCTLLRAIFYIFMQLLGAAGGAGLLRVSTPSEIVGGLGMTTVNDDLSPAQGFIIETVITFMLVLVVAAVCDPNRADFKGSAAVAIGLAISAGHLAAIDYTGSSMNPARTFGPCVIQGEFSDHWVYWAGPLLGGVLAGILYVLVFRVEPTKEDGDY